VVAVQIEVEEVVVDVWADQESEEELHIGL
jgi:hypothetical protein